MSESDKLRQVIWEAVSDTCEGRTGGEPHTTTWARGGYRNDVPMLCDRCARLIETLTSRLSAAEVRSTDTEGES